jgi:hypothetical protein
VLGEVDVLKSILLLPGANAGEAPPVSMWWWSDQNLIYWTKEYL